MQYFYDFLSSYKVITSGQNGYGQNPNGQNTYGQFVISRSIVRFARSVTVLFLLCSICLLSVTLFALAARCQNKTMTTLPQPNTVQDHLLKMSFWTMSNQKARNYCHARRNHIEDEYSMKAKCSHFVSDLGNWL